MPFHPCVSGCGRYLAPGDGHDHCLSCLDVTHTEVAFVDKSCSHCEKTIFPEKGWGALLAVAGLVLQWRWGIPLRGTKLQGLLLPPALRSLWSCRSNRLDPLTGYLVSFDASPMIGCRLLHWRSQIFLEMMIRDHCHLLSSQGCRILIRKCWLYLPGPPRGLRSSGNLHHVPNSRGWTIGFSGWLVLVVRAPPHYLSSRRYMIISLGRGRHISLPETTPVACPPSPTSMLGQRGVYGDSAGGAVGCDAIVSKYPCHLAWKSVAPHPGL